MKTRNILIGLALVLALCSCGAQKAAKKTTPPPTGPLVQTTFFGNKFGDKYSKVKTRMFKYYPMANKDGSLTILNMTFGGEEWHYTQFHFTEKLFYHINFQQEFGNEYRAREKYNRVRRTLETKYGYMDPLTDGEEGCKFIDERMNMVILSTEEGVSKGGATYWYCTLDYTFAAGAFLSVMSTVNEM